MHVWTGYRPPCVIYLYIFYRKEKWLFYCIVMERCGLSSRLSLLLSKLSVTESYIRSTKAWWLLCPVRGLCNTLHSCPWQIGLRACGHWPCMVRGLSTIEHLLRFMTVWNNLGDSLTALEELGWGQEPALCRKLPTVSVSTGWGPFTCSWHTFHPRSLFVFGYSSNSSGFKDKPVSVTMGLKDLASAGFLVLTLMHMWVFCLFSPKEGNMTKSTASCEEKYFSLARCPCMPIYWHAHTVSWLYPTQSTRPSTTEDMRKLSAKHVGRHL